MEAPGRAGRGCSDDHIATAGAVGVCVVLVSGRYLCRSFDICDAGLVAWGLGLRALLSLFGAEVLRDRTRIEAQ